jgi:glycosyltransferase involved in cell wall biosynthesis
MSRQDCFVSVIAPLRNDADIIDAFIPEVMTALEDAYVHYELVLVDDGSTDATVERVRQMIERYRNLRLIRLSRRFGQEIAISAGLDSVIGDFVVVMLPDSDPPALIVDMVERARQGAGIVFGVRRDRAGEPWLLRTGAGVFYWLARRVLRLDIPPNTTHFRVLSRQAVNALTQIKDRSRYLHTLSSYVGYLNQAYPYDPVERRKHPRRKSLGEAVRLAVRISVANSTQPLRLASVVGLGASVANLLYMVYIAGVYFFKDEVAEGWVTSSAQAAAMFFFLFLILTVLCEYVGRLLDEVKGRPLYYVMEEHQGGVPVGDHERNVVSESVSR